MLQKVRKALIGTYPLRVHIPVTGMYPLRVRIIDPSIPNSICPNFYTPQTKPQMQPGAYLTPLQTLHQPHPFPDLSFRPWMPSSNYPTSLLQPENHRATLPHPQGTHMRLCSYPCGSTVPTPKHLRGCHLHYLQALHQDHPQTHHQGWIPPHATHPTGTLCAHAHRPTIQWRT